MDSTRSYVRIPTIELIRRALCAHGVGALIETSVRELARIIGRSPGQISGHLDQLEEDGWIRRLTDHAGTVVEVLRGDHAHDRSFTASQSDHADDRSVPTDHPTAVPNPVRAADHFSASLAADQESDPPYNPRMVLTTATAVAEFVAVNSDGGMQGGGRPADQPHPIALLLAELGLTPGHGVFERGMAARAWTPQQIRDRYGYDKPRIEGSGGKKTWGIFWTAFIAGELAPACRDPDRTIEPQDYASDSLYRMGSDTSGLDPRLHEQATESPPDDGETPSQTARRILPHDASQADWVFVACRISRGDSEAGAIEALIRHRTAVRR